MKKVLMFAVVISIFLKNSFIVFAQEKRINNIVIVHGAFADGSGWQEVFNILSKKGYNVTIVQNPLTSLNDDVNATNRILDKQDGATVLVGHSWGGVVITEAGVHQKVARLVYVAAFVPEENETALDLIKRTAPAAENGILPPDEKGFVYYEKQKFHLGFAADISKDKTDFMFASQAPISGQSFLTPLRHAAWKSKISYAVVATEDKSISPETERYMYHRAGCVVRELKGSHVIYMSKAREVASVIEAAAVGESK